MWATRAKLMVVALAWTASSVRVSDDDELSVEEKWLTHHQRFCMSGDSKVSCDGDASIQVGSAFLSKAWSGKCKSYEGAGASEEPCNDNVTASVLKLCQGKATCQVPPETYSAACHQAKSSVRIVWNCAAVSDEEPAAPAAPVAAAPAEEEEASSSEEEEAEPTKELEVSPETAAGEAKEVIKKVTEEEEHEITFNPCFRLTRWQLMRRGNLLNAITAKQMCPSGEDCFQLTWSDGKVFKDEAHPPSNEEILEASIGHTGSGGELTLKTSDYSTWGVCLPLKQSADFAAALFKNFKK